ncbi:MAG: polysaccharide deacetylase family protein [Lachnospiraceae bacterium]|nr:polysaccharide deacetylase family protein [Lachnospiraceae bacterium]
MAFHKYLTFSFDDGLEQDKRLIRLMKKYGLKGTFNLNAGLFGKKDWVGRIGNIGFKEYNAPGNHGIIKTVEHFRIPKDEIRQVYEGFEVASHAYRHEALPGLKADRFDEVLGRDIDELSELVGYQVAGHAFPGGMSSKEARAYLKERGILYGRGAFSNGKFTFPEEPVNYSPTCSIKDKNVITLFDKFLASEIESEDLLFCMWGHGYEMDYGTARASEEAFEKIFDYVSGREDIMYCTNKEAFSRELLH